MDFKTTNFSEGPKELKDIFFNRPVSTLGRSQVAILVSRNTSLGDVSKAYEILNCFGHNCVLIVDEKLKMPGLPASIILQSGRQTSYANSDEAIEQIKNSSALLVLAATEANAAMQVLISKLEDQDLDFVQTDNKSFFSSTWKSRGKLCLGSTSKLLSSVSQVRSKSTGLKLKSDYLYALSENLSSAIVAIDPHQALALDAHDRENVAVINSERLIDRLALSVIVFGLLAERPQPLQAGWLDYILAAGHLYCRHYAESGTRGLRQFLNSQF